MDLYGISLHSCTSCGKNYDNKAKLKKHIGQVHDIRIRKCEECGKLFTGNMRLATHMKSHQTFKCHICLKDVPKNSAYSHKYQCRGLKIMCSNCPFETIRPDSLKMHKKIHEEKIVTNKTDKKKRAIYICGYYGKRNTFVKKRNTLGKRSTLNNHLSTHTPENKYHCSQCEKLFFDKYNLERHMNSKHINKVSLGIMEDDIQCTQCEYKTKRKYDLKEHIERVHLKENNSFKNGLDCGMKKDPQKVVDINVVEKIVMAEDCQEFMNMEDMGGMKVARKALRRARISCDGYKKCLQQVVEYRWSPEDNLDILNKMDKAMDNFIKCSDDVIVLHDDSGDDEQNDIDAKNNAVADYLKTLNEFKMYRANFHFNGDKYAKC